jgi:beta-lactamase regulating signal transducer with metallopeptidase domain
MMFIDAFRTQMWVEPLGWTLLHSIWQGALITVVTWLVLRQYGVQLRSPTRYALCCAALGLSVVIPVITFALFIVSPDRGGMVNPVAAVAPVAGVITRTMIPPSLSAGALLVLPWVVLAWMIGVFTRALWITGAWLAVRRVVRAATQPANVMWVRVLEKLQRDLRVEHHVGLRLSVLVDVPCVVGWLRPIILLPPAACLGLSPQQMEAVLAHELAHIKRHDFLINSLQRIAEALLFYHPGAWWVSRQIRMEREHCCDDAAVAACPDVVAYARALTTLEVSRHASEPLLAVTGGDLVGRIRRLLSGRENPVSGLAPVTAVTFLLIAIGAYAFAAPASRASVQQDSAGMLRETSPGPTQELIRQFDSGRTRRDKVDAMSRLSGDLSAAAWQKLVLVAERDSDFEVRKEAVSYIAGRATPAAVQELIRLYGASREQAFKLHVLSYLSGLHTAESMAKIREIADGETDAVIREQALDYVLGR